MRVEIGQTARRQRRAARRELEEGFALVGIHRHQYVDEALEAGTVARVAQFVLRVVEDVLARPTRTLVAAEQQPQLGRTESGKARHGEHAIEATSKRLHLPTDADLEAKIRHELHVVFPILQCHLNNNNQEARKNGVSQ